MALLPTSPPAVEPVSLAEAKAHLRIDGNTEDTLLQSLMLAARVHLELVLARAFIAQGWTYLRDTWPAARELALPLAPVASVTSVVVIAADGTRATLDPAAYLLDGSGNTPRLVLAGSTPLPRPGRVANGIEITFVAGHGSTGADVPAPLRHAILLLAAHWYENRQPVEIGLAGEPLPLTIAELIAPYRRRRL